MAKQAPTHRHAAHRHKRHAIAVARRWAYGRPHSRPLTLTEAKAFSALAYDGKPEEPFTYDAKGKVLRFPGPPYDTRVAQSALDKKWIVAKDGVFANWIIGFRAVVIRPTHPRDGRIVLAFKGTTPPSKEATSIWNLL